jgi:hypothetical protein
MAMTTSGMNNTVTPEKYKKTFFQTAGGVALTGGLGALIGMGQRHAQKLARAKQQEQQGMQNLMNMEMAPEQQQALAQSNVMANQGMDAASLQIAREENARAQNAQFSALSGKRALLSAMPGLSISSGDFAKRLAASNAMMRSQNQLSNIGFKMQYGQQANALQMSKNEALINQGTAERSRLNQTLSSGLSALGQIAGAAIGAGGKK